MCGIAGIVGPRGAAADPRGAMRTMLACMRARGPDAEGTWHDEDVVLGHRRLAIIDLDRRSDQPMRSADGRYVVVFNGEIYNHRELRAAREAAGDVFRTTSDTEVLLALYAHERERMLPRLRGMFAFAIWDTRARELFLARDPYGIKPLYYAAASRTVVFASQVKALVAAGAAAGGPEPAGLAGFYLWGSVPEPWTLHAGVRSLPAGHWLRVVDGATAAPVLWHDIRDHWRRPASAPSAGLRERVRQAVRDSVRAHLVADVPVSVFLSGGIDSGALAALAREQGADLEAVTLGFEEYAGRREDEVPVAAAVAAHYGLRHHVRRVSRAEFDADVPRIVDAMDQPSIDGVNTWFASKAAAERGYKVVLSGVGGDELFCGYPSFVQVPRLAAVGGALAAACPGARPVLDALCGRLAPASRPKLAGLAGLMDSVEGAYFLRRALFLPSELPALMGADAAREGLARLGGTPPGVQPARARDPRASVGLLESTLYLRNQLLRDSDWASMGHSLELRTPLVDATLLEALAPCVAGFARGTGKALLAHAPLRPLPDIVLRRRKTGFNVPMAAWLAEQDAAPGGRRLGGFRRWAVAVARAFGVPALPVQAGPA
ncbi:MAG TPA: asparagine synthase (glutamine-hydrolyzing) [Casimicrobiaceae bacterium]|nr:asparagine synthase (glutamine-hydrolyzing) [Casimicrobiaceae bacterium]